MAARGALILVLLLALLALLALAGAAAATAAAPTPTDAHLEHLNGRPANAVLAQLLQLEALAVLPPHIHQERVVGNSEDARGLRRGHLLVPHVLERFRQLCVRPRAGGTTSRRGVLSLGSGHCKRRKEMYGLGRATTMLAEHELIAALTSANVSISCLAPYAGYIF